MFDELMNLFRRRPILGTPSSEPEATIGELRARAADARMLMESAAYQRAYQRSLDSIIDALLALDVTKPEDRDRAIHLVARAQQQREIVVELRSALTDYEVARAREERQNLGRKAA